ncbi:MAG: acetylglutamate kinase [Oscillospiraceae bacterium]|nr:acetylglutamate kinase [Oscillospiraceae bacterium]
MDELIRKAGILIEALPYMQRLYGKTVVIKYGGNAMVSGELVNSVMEDITLLKYIGLNPIVVHGGGPDISRALKSYGVESTFVGGLRVTDALTMEVAQMVLVGKTNKEIVSMLNSKGGRAVGVCGIDGGIVGCRRLTRLDDGTEADLGFVGEITEVRTELLERLSAGGYIPVVAPIGADGAGQSYNINADTVAGRLASAMGAEKLILLTDVEGIMGGDREVYSALAGGEAMRLIADKVISGGMIPKVMCCIDAISGGVGKAHILDGTIPHAILLEIFTNKGIGTMITGGVRVDGGDD